MSIEGARVGQRYDRHPIAADAGFIRAHNGGFSGGGAGTGRRLSGADVAAAAGKFVNPDGTTFYPGGTSW